MTYPWTEQLLTWYRRHRRDLPWRRALDPYATWVSEVMLQQTQAAAVIPYYERWMERFPTVEALAGAGEDDVLHAWQGLGYYSRARNLLRGAREVAERHAGRVPDAVPELLALPGIGPYTAGAIASIAYNVRAPVVDGNVIRVLTRLFAMRGDPGHEPLNGRIWQLAEEVIPEGQAGDFNQALMELGARICTPGNPRCVECPVASACEARRLGAPEQFPETAPRPKVTDVRMAAGLVLRGERVLLVQRRPDESRWAGMWQFPSTEVRVEEPVREAVCRAVAEAVGLEVTTGDPAVTIRHGVTRFRITLEAYFCRNGAGEAAAAGRPGWEWVLPDDLRRYALPAAHRKIADRALLREGDDQLALGFGD